MVDSKPLSEIASLQESCTVPLRLHLQPAGPAIELTRSGMVLGRHTGVDVRLPLPDVSRWHCRFVFAENAWHIEDLDSLNGVFVNGQRVPKARLYDADRVGIGGFAFEVQFDRGAPPVCETASIEETMEQVDALPMPNQALIMTQRKAS